MTVNDAQKIIKEKEQEALERNLEDKMYTEFWAKDREAKDLKDAQEEEEKRKKNVENGKFIREQMLMNELEKQKRVREKDHDHVVMVRRDFVCNLVVLKLNDLVLLSSRRHVFVLAHFSTVSSIIKERGVQIRRPRGSKFTKTCLREDNKKTIFLKIQFCREKVMFLYFTPCL